MHSEPVAENQPHLLKTADIMAVFRLLATLGWGFNSPHMWKRRLVGSLAVLLGMQVALIQFPTQVQAGALLTVIRRKPEIDWADPNPATPSALMPEELGRHPMVAAALQEIGATPGAGLPGLAGVQNGIPMTIGTFAVTASGPGAPGLLQAGEAYDFPQPIPPPLATDRVIYVLDSKNGPPTPWHGQMIALFHTELCRLLQQHVQEDPQPGAMDLPPRQRQVLEALLTGCSERQVAEKVGVSEHTVHSHIRRLYARFGVASRGELFAVCYAKERFTALSRLQSG